MAEGMSEHFQQFFVSAREALRSLVPKRLRSDIPVVPVVRLSGVIGFSTPLKPGLTLAGLARQLDRAFTMRNARAVALVINSPGGSPVQSHLIYHRIRALAAENQRPVIAFTEDVAASGATCCLRGRRDHLRSLLHRWILGSSAAPSGFVK
jgi:ClpP class serine protease